MKDSELRIIAKPLVFISSSHLDQSWRDRLKSLAGTLPDPVLDWWDASKITTGDQWKNEIEAAIRRATIAVVFLSPAYLSSEAAISELTQLITEAESRELKLLPIVLEECAWQQFEFLKRIQIWSGAKPLTNLPPATIDDELIAIASHILKLLPTSPVPLGQGAFIFSDTTNSILSQARSLAYQSDRAIVTSSCILFAFAEKAGSRQDTTWFVRKTFERNGGYEQAFKTFLGDAYRATDGDVIQGLPGRFSLNTIAVIEYAATVASRVSRGASEIHPRHLFAGLLVSPGSDRTPAARGRLTRQGFDLTALAVEFLEFLRTYAVGDDLTEWIVILAPLQVHPPATTVASPFISGTPGYTPEFCGLGGTAPVKDHLGVEELARRLAELIVSRETKLPLAIGLFGNWGSGKSHFMNLMDRHMKRLSKENAGISSLANYAPVLEDPWCREIVPIYFNAWHYSDCNLWASLVTEVFDSLFSYLEPKANELALLQSRLQDAGGVTALAVEEVRDAINSQRQAAEIFQQAQAASDGAHQVVHGLLNGLRTLVPELNTSQNRDRVAELLGVSSEVATLSELIEKRKELSSVLGRTKELWRRAIAPEGRAARFGWLAGAVVSVTLIQMIALHVPHVQVLVTQAGPVIRAFIVALSAGIGWMIPAVNKVQSGLGVLEKWQKKAEDTLSAMPNDPKLIAAQREMLRCEATAKEAEAVLARAQSLELQLRKELNDLRPEHRLSRFIEARARSADYRGHLGLVSLARRDFEELNHIFTDREALWQTREEIAEQREPLQRLRASVDRIVLFIDDLDRCGPEKIIDVLQAVHLLLAYPLFAVVVGVDQRCLKQSLHMRIKGLLTQDRNDSSGSDGLHDDEAPATPLDYLEKIFQIPFHLPTMSEIGFAHLLETLTEPTTPPPYPKLGAAKVVPLTERDLPKEPQQPTTTGNTENGAVAYDNTYVASNTAIISNKESASVVGSVPLLRWERDALKDYYSLVRTPRGTTRLLNTYRLVRAGVPEQEWDKFRGDNGGMKEFRLAMLLLAVAAGQPSVARDWFKLLRQYDFATLPDEAAGVKGSQWDNFRNLCNATSKQVMVPFTKDLVAKWLDRVERYTF